MDLVEREAIFGQVKRLADLGCGGWRVPTIDTQLLASTPFVAAELRALGAQARKHPDAIWEVLGDAIQTAISMLPADESRAAFLHFGFDDEDAATSLTERKREAATCLNGGRSLRWYTGPQRYSLGLKPEDYVIELVAAALVGVPDPISWVRSNTPTAKDEHEARVVVAATHYDGVLSQALIYASDRERANWSFSPAPPSPDESLARYQARHHLRVRLQGPSFLFPREIFAPCPHGFLDDAIERSIGDFTARHIAVTCGQRNPQVRIALTCPENYFWTIARFIPDEKLDEYFDYAARRIDELFGRDASRGSDVVMRAAGKYNAGFVTSDLSLKCIAGEWVTTMHVANDSANWHREYLGQFDEAFDAEYEGQAAACSALHKYLAMGREELRPKDYGESALFSRGPDVLY